MYHMSTCDLVNSVVRSLCKVCPCFVKPISATVTQNASSITCDCSDHGFVYTGHTKYILKPFNTVRDLGLRHDTILNFSEHTANQVPKARKLVGFTMINFKNIESRLLLLYKKCTIRILRYRVLVYSNCRRIQLINLKCSRKIN